MSTFGCFFNSLLILALFLSDFWSTVVKRFPNFIVKNHDGIQLSNRFIIGIIETISGIVRVILYFMSWWICFGGPSNNGALFGILLAITVVMFLTLGFLKAMFPNYEPINDISKLYFNGFYKIGSWLRGEVTSFRND